MCGGARFMCSQQVNKGLMKDVTICLGDAPCHFVQYEAAEREQCLGGRVAANGARCGKDRFQHAPRLEVKKSEFSGILSNFFEISLNFN